MIRNRRSVLRDTRSAPLHASLQRDRRGGFYFVLDRHVDLHQIDVEDRVLIKYVAER